MDEVVEAYEKYKGLVPLVYDIETMSLDVARSEDMQYAVYLKREADKAIAEKDKEIARLDDLAHAHNLELLQKENCIAEKDEAIDELKERNDELQKATDSAWSKVNAMYDELSHQKYKRCLTMAMWCWAIKELNIFGDQDYMDFAEKWHRRWLTIAEKFKTN